MEQWMGGRANDAEKVWHGKVDSSGRILIPTELREKLNAEAGTRLVWSLGESGLSLMTYDQTIRQIQSYFQSLSPPEDVWSETLIAERKRQAAIENGRLDELSGVTGGE